MLAAQGDKDRRLACLPALVQTSPTPKSNNVAGLEGKIVSHRSLFRLQWKYSIDVFAGQPGGWWGGIEYRLIHSSWRGLDSETVCNCTMTANNDGLNRPWKLVKTNNTRVREVIFLVWIIGKLVWPHHIIVPQTKHISTSSKSLLFFIHYFTVFLTLQYHAA